MEALGAETAAFPVPVPTAAPLLVLSPDALLSPRASLPFPPSPPAPFSRVRGTWMTLTQSPSPSSRFPSLSCRPSRPIRPPHPSFSASSSSSSYSAFPPIPPPLPYYYPTPPHLPPPIHPPPPGESPGPGESAPSHCGTGWSSPSRTGRRRISHTIHLVLQLSNHILSYHPSATAPAR